VFAASPVIAADCNFTEGFDAKVIRFAWPPAIGVNVGVVDFEVGAKNYGLDLCGNASVKVLGLFCLIPKVDGLLGGFCGVGEPAE
jgi:hypothetical protein